MFIERSAVSNSLKKTVKRLTLKDEQRGPRDILNDFAILNTTLN
jgi:hypothetical protein